MSPVEVLGKDSFDLTSILVEMESMLFSALFSDRKFFQNWLKGIVEKFLVKLSQEVLSKFSLEVSC